ncbi:MAG: hypothetical protein M3Y72_04830 [Acidobacteriota bacterium]|nr:hypothetical protein [Acidobacteriota bacterium]
MSQPEFHNIEIAHASVEELDAGYLQWAVKHRAAIGTRRTIKINMPYIDLYSSAGVSVYHGDDSERNASFISKLPQSIQGAKNDSVRPTLKEAMEMVPELKAQSEQIMRDKRYTLFAVTFPNWNEAMEQNKAVADFERRSSRTGIRVIEVRLQR